MRPAATMRLTATRGRSPKLKAKTAMTVAMPGAQTTRGFSLVELVIVVAFALILSAIAMPAMKRTLRGYQMNDAANQVAGIVKFTRFEAIPAQLASNLREHAKWCEWAGNDLVG